MIHEIGKELEAKLVEQGCPFKVIDREGTKPTTWRNVIVIEHTTDTIGPTRSQSLNPKRYWTRNVGAKITIYAQSTASGALEFEHRRVAERALDLVLVALRKVCAERRIGLSNPSGRFVTIPDLERSERQGGAVYELSFSVERGVADRTWAGAAAAEATLGLYVMTGSPGLTFSASGKTITRSAGSWVTDGFVVGMTVRVTGSTENNVTGAITDITESVMTLGATSLTDEGPVSGCTVEAGGVTSCTQVAIGDSTPETACGDC